MTAEVNSERASGDQ